MKILHCHVKIRKIYKDPKCAYSMDVNMGSLGKSDDVGVTLHLSSNHQNLSPPPWASQIKWKRDGTYKKNANFNHNDRRTRLYSLDFEESSHLFIYSSQLNLRLGFLLLMPKSLCVYKSHCWHLTNLESSFFVGWLNFSISQRCTLPLCNAKIR